MTKFEFNEDQKEIIKEWVGRLRSGKYKQGQNNLVTLRKNKKPKYCCLGVLAEMAYEKGIVAKRVKVIEPGLSVINYSNNEYAYGYKTLPEVVSRWAGFVTRNNLIDENPVCYSEGSNNTYAGLNDAGKTFAEIADLIEQDYLNDTGTEGQGSSPSESTEDDQA